MSKAPKQADLIICVNAGSSSLKVSAYQLAPKNANPTWLADANIASVAAPKSELSASSHLSPGSKHEETIQEGLKSHTEAFKKALSYFKEAVQVNLNTVTHICHRVVHGGRFTQPMVLHKDAIEEIRRLSDLAPLHNGSALAVIETCHDLLPHAVPVAMFDTMFHTTMPEQIASYAINPEVASKRGLKRYGFHGLSYGFILSSVAEHFGKPADQMNLIVLHLGSGASACCIKDGKSLDTSMGLTPLSGLPGATRAGQVDPSLIFHYTNKADTITHDRQMTADLHVTDAEYILNSQSGWNALTGTKNFGQITQKAVEQLGDDPAAFYPGPQDAQAGQQKKMQPEALAFTLFIDRLLDFIAPYHLKLNGEVDAIVFAGGVGEKSHQLRNILASRLQCLGYPALDPRANAEADQQEAVVVPVDAAPKSDASRRLLVCHTNEQLYMARLCAETSSLHE